MTSWFKIVDIKSIFNAALFLLMSSNTFSQKPAEIIPAFSFLKLDNSRFTDQQLEKGKKSLIVFFDAECDHCQHAVEYINKNYDDFKKAAVYLVTQDEPVRIGWFMNKYGFNLNNKKNVTVLQDSQKEFIRKFTPRKYPSIFLYSEQRKLIMYDDNEQNLFKFSERINVTAK